MPKLHLKRTPQEDAAHRLRKRKRRHDNAEGQEAGPSGPSTSQGRPTPNGKATSERAWDDNESDIEYGPEPAPSFPRHFNPSVKSYHEVIREEEERRFREKMFDVLEDDGRLDTLEARFNDFSHIPERWRTKRGANNDRFCTDDIFTLDPQHMDEEEYTEWIRLGMYRCVRLV